MQMNSIEINSNIFFLNQGVEILSKISDEMYSSNDNVYHINGVGKHFRHIVEHYFSFLNEKDKLVDYDARDREKNLETNRKHMINSIEQVIEQLKLKADDINYLEFEVFVRSNEGVGVENSPLNKSTNRRELQFLVSHTVHHYALIGLILKSMDVEVAPEFGVAPSTLKFEFQNSLIKQS